LPGNSAESPARKTGCLAEVCRRRARTPGEDSPHGITVTAGTVTVLGCGTVSASFFIVELNPKGYADPDGRSDSSILERVKDLANPIDQFILENREALLTIALGGAQIVVGNALKGGGVGGGILLSGASGGILTPAGVAMGVAAVSAGEALEISGAVTVSAGLAMLASNNGEGNGNWSRQRQNSQKSHNQSDGDDIQKALKKINQETGQNLKIGTNEREAIHKAIREMKTEVNPPGSNQNLSQENLQKAIKYALNIE
jgi:hypothetical protein